MDEKILELKLAKLDSLQSACTHCGICSEGCATFQSSGWEHESPRGRLQLAAQFVHGKIPLQSSAMSTFDRCLGCKACENLCPQNVSYSEVRHLVQDIRRSLKMFPKQRMEEKEYAQWISLAKKISSIWWRRLAARWISIPNFNFRSKGSYIKKSSALNPANPVLAVCCVQDLFQHDAIEQAISFAKRLGYPLQTDRKQPCCGAIFERLVNGGEESILYSNKQSKAAELQKKSQKAFSKWKPSQLLFLSRNCQTHFIANHESIDLYSWIESILDKQALVLELQDKLDVYYQPYCAHLKKEGDSIWRLLHRIRGLSIREIPNSYSCCGGYCGEAFLHPEHAREIALKKISGLPPKSILVVASPDCWSLFKLASASLELKIFYPMDLLSTTIISHQ